MESFYSDVCSLFQIPVKWQILGEAVTSQHSSAVMVVPAVYI